MMLAGAIIGMVSVLMLWFSMDFILVRFDYSGLDFLLKSFDHPESYPSVGYYAYMPWIVLAASAAAMVFSILSFTKHERKGAAAGTALGSVILAATFLYVFYPASRIALSTPAADMIADIKLMNYLDAGVYCALIAGMLLVIGGIIILQTRKDGPET